MRTTNVWRHSLLEALVMNPLERADKLRQQANTRTSTTPCTRLSGIVGWHSETWLHFAGTLGAVGVL